MTSCIFTLLGFEFVFLIVNSHSCCGVNLLHLIKKELKIVNCKK